MSKIVGGLIIYIALGGFLAGLVVNGHYERTGEPCSGFKWIETAVWPAAIAFAFTVDEGAYITSKQCNYAED